MIGQWLQQKAIVLALEPTNFQVDRISLKLTLDCLLIVSTDALKTSQEVNFDQPWLVLVPTIVLYLNELHIAEVHGLSTRANNLGLFLLLGSCCLAFLLDSGSGLCLLNETFKATDFATECTSCVISGRLLFEGL